MRISRVFIHVPNSTITAHNETHYFVPALWSLVLTFLVLIPCELHSLLDTCPRSIRSFLFLGLMSFVSFVPVGHMFRWPAGYVILSVSSLETQELLMSLIYDPMLRRVLTNPLLWVVFASPSCELHLRACYLRVGSIQAMSRRSRSFLGHGLTIANV